MNILLFLLHLLVLAGLCAISLGIWFWRGGWQRLFALALATWFVGAMSVSLALRNRDALWLAKPHRAFRFARNAHPELLNDHHNILSPTSAERLPADFDALQHPVRLVYRFDLTTEGTVRNVTQVSVNKQDEKLTRATMQAIAAWRFGALPVNSPDPRTESVQVTITNRYSALISYSTLFLFTLIYGVIWFLLVKWTPEGKPASENPRFAVFDWKRVALLVGFLAGWGWLIVYRLSIGSVQFGLVESLTVWLGLSAITYGAGIVCAYRIGRVKTRRYTFKSVIWVVLGIGLLCLTFVPGFGMNSGTNAQLWIRLPGLLSFVKFQPIEVVKLLMVFYVASVAYENSRGGREQEGTSRVQFVPPVIRYAAVAGAFIAVLCVLAFMKDFGPLLLLFLLLTALFYVQGYPRWAAIGLILLLFLLTVSNGIGVPSRWQERVSVWRNPWNLSASESRILADAKANNAKATLKRIQRLGEGKEHTARARWAISSGGIFGSGLGRGMPEDVNEIVSDFLFTAMAEELGWIGCTALLGMFGYLIANSLWQARHIADAQAKMLIAGLGTLFGLQTILIVGGNLGCFPLTGITLPLLSYGGSSLVLTCFTFGLMVGAASRSTPMSPDFLGTSREDVNRCLGSLLPLCLGLLALLSGYQAWMQLPGSGTRTAQKQLARANGTVAGNPRFEGSPGNPKNGIRGSILARDGAMIAETRSGGRVLNQPQLYAQFTGLETPEGKMGVEAYLNEALKGALAIAGKETVTPSGERGFDVVLTLDNRLQQKAFDLLKKNGYSGAIVGIQPQTGEILFAVSRSNTVGVPTKAGAWQASNDGKLDAYPFCYRHVYAPGSTFKTLVSAALLEQVPNADELRFDCLGEYTPRQGRPIQDFERQHNMTFRGHGSCGLDRALTLSCNATFAQAGERLGWGSLYEFADKAGFHSYLPLIPDELRGQRKVWFESSPSVLTPNGELPTNLSAQERAPVFLAQTALGGRNVRMTPLHLALWAATIANGGNLMEPSVVKQVQERGGKIVWEQTPRIL